MFIFDIFKREARRLRTVSAVMAAGMLALLAGLWFVQIVSGKQMQGRLERQSFRKPRVPAERGRILDRDGQALVKNQPQYNVVVYLEDLRSQFTNEFSRAAKAYALEHRLPAGAKLPSKVAGPLRLEADYRVVSNLSYYVAAVLRQPMTLERERFWHFYSNYTFMPLQIMTNLNSNHVAVFAEQLSSLPGVDLERQPVVFYPYKTTAAHLLGYVVRTGEEKRYLAPGYKGNTGIEAAFEEQLKGEPGTNLVLVNNEGYRQHEEVLAARQAGKDIFLTISLPLQQAAEAALGSGDARGGGGDGYAHGGHSGDGFRADVRSERICHRRFPGAAGAARMIPGSSSMIEPGHLRRLSSRVHLQDHHHPGLPGERGDGCQRALPRSPKRAGSRPRSIQRTGL